MRVAIGMLAVAALLGCGAAAHEPAPQLVEPARETDAPPREIPEPPDVVALPRCASPGSRLSWRGASPLPAGRRRHAAALLADGRVIVAGGVGSATTELYEPAGDRSHRTAPMSEARAEHTLTLLADGRALAVGGWSDVVTGIAALAQTAEPFDPTSGAWTIAGAQLVPRYRHTATLLTDRRVLVVGGQASAGTLGPQIASAELFEPATRTWIAAAPLARPRMLYTATLLADGRVTGLNDAVAEIYDPSTDRWTRTGADPRPRMEHLMFAFPGGRIVLFGGIDSHYDPPLLEVEIGEPCTLG